MIQKPTILILGAGTSVDFGYPLGEQLRSKIWTELGKTGSPLHDALLACDFSASHIAEFQHELGAAQPRSVDEFLGQRAEFQDIGKCAIAAALIEQEHESRLTVPAARESWFGRLLDALRTAEGFGSARFSIITFNYDRALDHFCFLANQSYYRASDTEAVEMLLRLRILHVYGQLAPLPYIGPGGRPYASEFSPELIRKAASKIFTIADIPLQPGGLPAIVERMQFAKVVAFLGFAYHLQNLALLGLDRLDRDARLYCGAFRTTALDRADILERLRACAPGLSPGRVSFGDPAWKTADVLDNLPILRQVERFEVPT